MERDDLDHRFDADPGAFVERVSRLSGEVLPGPIRPEELLVGAHRDVAPLDVLVRAVSALAAEAIGSERPVRPVTRRVRQVARRVRRRLAGLVGEERARGVVRRALGYDEPLWTFRLRREWARHEGRDRARRARAREEAEEQLAALRRRGEGLRVLVTGGSGFIGQELLTRLAREDEVAEVIVLLRPKQVRDRVTGEVVATRSPAERGEELLGLLDLGHLRHRFRFVAGDIEQPHLGLAEGELERLRREATHVLHAAASVSFDDPYEACFRANVLGTRHVLDVVRDLQTAGAPLVACLCVETSFIHGRRSRGLAREDRVEFPDHYYNNYYEVTKAFASLESERAVVVEGLRVSQLCPAIVIGEARTGNNRGDTKVLNAPINLVGRVRQAAAEEGRGPLLARPQAWLLGQVAAVFPGHPSAEIDLVPVDRVAAGIVAALTRPAAVGERIHLATDRRITTGRIRDIVHEELGVQVALAEPTLHRTVGMPLVTRLLAASGQDRLAQGLGRLTAVFGGYGERGQPRHEVGKDVSILGLPLPRPDTEQAFRMLCRHNRYVQEFGRVRDPRELARREGVWSAFCDAVERGRRAPPGALPPGAFRRELNARLDLGRFELLGTASLRSAG